MTSTFGSRIRLAITREAAVQEKLLRRGWGCWSWGQALLPYEAREALKHTDSYLRNEADLLAIRGDCVYLVDVKGGGGDYPDYVLEKRVLEAGKASVERVPVLLVWHDFRVSYVADLSPTRTAPYNGRGSGTPMWKVSKAGADGPVVDFDDVFGQESAS